MEIVYATDGSRGATAAGEFLARLRLTAADRILLLAIEPHSVAAGEPDYFGPARAALAGCAAAIETEVRSGPTADRILAVAAERGAGLIALGAMGATALERFFLGSVAERVLRHAAASVLIARPVRHNLSRALVAVDGSETGPRVVAAAAGLSLPESTELRLISVLPPREAICAAAPLVWAGFTGELDAALQGAVLAGEERLRSLAGSLRHGGRHVSAELVRGEPASALVHTVESESVDLLVVGSHGEGGLDRFLLGSVSERVARHARCSVLVAR